MATVGNTAGSTAGHVGKTRPTGKALRENTLRFKYGIEPEEFDRLLTEQGGHCAICPATDDLCVDHNHETGKVRGILCRHCNAGLGQFRDDLERMRAAVKYLELDC